MYKLRLFRFRRIELSSIEIKNVSHTYGKNKVLDNVSLSIKEGEFFTLLGPSGCGKTTLLRLIAGFANLQSGDILMDKKSIANVAAERRNIGFVFQNYALFPHMTVWENVCFGLKMKKESHENIDIYAKKYLQLVDMYSLRDRRIDELSGGQQQRTAVARSLATEPRILLLDEPMSNLDVSLREEMRNEIKRIQKELSITMVFVTHDQNEALCISDKIAVFNKGSCLQCDTPENIYFYPKDDFTAGFLGKTNIFPREFLKGEGIDISSPKLYVRPESIEVRSEKENGTIEACISKKQFLGNVTRYFCICKEKEIIFDELSRAFTRDVGQRVWLRLF